MEYTSVTLEDKITGLKNRVRQLEEEYFGNEVFILEADSLGYKEDVDTLRSKNKGIELRRNNHLALIEKLSGEHEPTKRNDPE